VAKAKDLASGLKNAKVGGVEVVSKRALIAKHQAGFTPFVPLDKAKSEALFKPVVNDDWEYPEHGSYTKLVESIKDDPYKIYDVK